MQKLKSKIENYPLLFLLLKKIYYTIFKEQAADFTVISYNMYELGFVERGERELLQLFEEGNSAVRKEAAAHLALWYANHFSGEAAGEAERYLRYMEKYGRKRSSRRQSLFLEAECAALLEGPERAHRLLSQTGKRPDPVRNMAMTRYIDSAEEWDRNIGAICDFYGLERVRGASGGELICNVPERDKTEGKSGEALVSVIVPVVNPVGSLESSLRSLMAQTWRNLEIVIVDATLFKDTRPAVESVIRDDPRARLIRYENGSCFFDALNRGYNEASGEYVTCLEADSWIHPRRIELQARLLEKNPVCIAAMVRNVRCDEQLRLLRGKEPDTYLFTDLRSLMFRRKKVFSELGYWDSVREDGEREMLARLRKHYGNRAVETLGRGPVVWKRSSSAGMESLTGFIKQNYLYDGARQRYWDSYTEYHNTAASLHIPWSQEKGTRRFPAPYTLLPEYDPGRIRHFDVIDVSDFRLPGGTTGSVGEELKAQKMRNMRTGLVQMPLYGFSREKPVSGRILSQADEKDVRWIGSEEEVSCDVLVLRHPPVLQDEIRFVPKIKTKNIAVVINQAPRRDYGGPVEKTFIYDIGTCKRNLLRYFGCEGVWYPNGSVLRESLKLHHREEIDKLVFSDRDWANIINVDEWKRDRRPAGDGVVRIGRHSRDHYVKWPADAETIRRVYPAGNGYEVHVLGGASSVKRIMAPLPKNWRVYEFGSMDPKEFLSQLDVFVYYHHPDWVEPNARNVIEAMAVGVPVITGDHFKDLYKEAAIYARPEEVEEIIKKLMGDDRMYEDQVKRARDFVRETYGYHRHYAQLEKNGSYYSTKKR